MVEAKKPAASRRTTPGASKATQAGEAAKESAASRRAAPGATKASKAAMKPAAARTSANAAAPKPTRSSTTKAPRKSAGQSAASGRTKPNIEELTEISTKPRRRVTKAAAEDPVLGAVDLATGEVGGGEAATESAAAEPAAKKVKMSLYAFEEIANRARAAYAHTHIYEGVVTFSEFLEQAILEKSERLEASYNGGQPWPPLEPGRVATGRPIR